MRVGRMTHDMCQIDKPHSMELNQSTILSISSSATITLGMMESEVGLMIMPDYWAPATVSW